MTAFDSSHRSLVQGAQADPQTDSVPKLLETVRLDRAVPSSDPYLARPVQSALLPALTLLAAMKEQGALSLNFTARSCDLPLRFEIKDLPADVEQKIALWKVEARAEPDKIDAIIVQLRKLGVEAIALTSSTGDARSPKGYAWICAANYDDLSLITVASKKDEAAGTSLDASLPSAVPNTVPVSATGSTQAQTIAA